MPGSRSGGTKKARRRASAPSGERPRAKAGVVLRLDLDPTSGVDGVLGGDELGDHRVVDTREIDALGPHELASDPHESSSRTRGNGRIDASPTLTPEMVASCAPLRAQFFESAPDRPADPKFRRS